MTLETLASDHGVPLRLLRGPAEQALLEVVASPQVVAAVLGADLVVLSWSQDSSVGHAAVVRHVLETSTIPVLLLPVAPSGNPGAEA